MRDRGPKDFRSDYYTPYAAIQPRRHATHLFDEPPRDRVERVLVRRKHLHSERLVGARDSAERRPAELHAPAEHARAIRARHPACGGPRVRLCSGGGRVEQRYLVEAPAQLGVGRAEEGIHLAKVLDVRRRKGGVGLEAFEEDNYGRVRSAEAT